MYRVRWEESALNELASLWLQADSALRAAITAAAHQIEVQLLADPMSESESRPGGRRIQFVSPLGATFRIEADSRTISVLRVWQFRKRS